MDSRLTELLKENNLQVDYLPVHGKGYYIEMPDDHPDEIILSSSLSEFESRKVIYHEIGHKLNDNDVPGDYHDDYLTHIVCEDCADNFKVKMMVAELVSLNYDISSINYVDLAKAIGARDADQVRKELQQRK